MAPERPSYVLEQQYPHTSQRRTAWSPYDTYRSFGRAREQAALLNRPCRITQCRVVWRSVPIRQRRR